MRPRRQAHEAVVHCRDAELAVGDVRPIEPALAADGVTEFLIDQVCASGYPMSL